MTRYLLDTNIVSELARSAPDADVHERYHARERESAISSVVWHELVYGVERLAPGRRRTRLRQYLQEVVRAALPVLPFDAKAAAWLGRERARLESIGQPPPFTDGMIAATAATQNLILVTRNTSDFDGFDGLHIENWFEAG